MNLKFVILGLFIFTTVHCNSQNYCNTNSIKLLARLYYITNALNVHRNPQIVEKFIYSNRHLLTQNSPAINFAHDLGNYLTNYGINAYNQKDYKDAYSSAVSMGANSDMAYDVASSFNSQAVDAYMFGQELLWLAQVIPQAAQGNWTPFTTSTTTTRQALRQVLPIYAATGMLDDPILLQVMNQLGPILEYQIAVLGLWMCN